MSNQKSKKSIFECWEIRYGTEVAKEKLDDWKKSLSGKTPWNKNHQKIQQLSLDGELIAEWEGLSDITEKTNFNKSSLSNALCNRRKTAYGFIWNYKN